jgi:putative intracellular protease/amidase
VHSLRPSEAQRIAEKESTLPSPRSLGSDRAGELPELELWAQISSDPDPVGRLERVGRIVLDRNPDSFLAQVDQAPFHAGHVVDGIEATAIPGTSDRSVAAFHRAALGTDVGIEAARSRKVAILAADGVDLAALQAMQDALRDVGAVGKIVAKRIGILTGGDGHERLIDHSLPDDVVVLFDAIYVPGGARSVAALVDDPDAVAFVAEAYADGKAIAATGEGLELLRACGGDLAASNGIGQVSWRAALEGALRRLHRGDRGAPPRSLTSEVAAERRCREPEADRERNCSREREHELRSRARPTRTVSA